MSDSVRPNRRQPNRLPRPWDSPGKSTGVGCHCLLQRNGHICLHWRKTTCFGQLKIQTWLPGGPPEASVPFMPLIISPNVTWEWNLAFPLLAILQPLIFASEMCYFRWAWGSACLSSPAMLCGLSSQQTMWAGYFGDLWNETSTFHSCLN